MKNGYSQMKIKPFDQFEIIRISQNYGCVKFDGYNKCYSLRNNDIDLILLNERKEFLVNIAQINVELKISKYELLTNVNSYHKYMIRLCKLFSTERHKLAYKLLNLSPNCENKKFVCVQWYNDPTIEFYPDNNLHVFGDYSFLVFVNE